MISYDLEIKLILASIIIDTICITWLLFHYTSKKEKSLYWKIIIISGIVFYITLTLIENPYLAFGAYTVDPYGTESYAPVTRIAIALCPGLITTIILYNIKSIKDEMWIRKRRRH